MTDHDTMTELVARLQDDILQAGAVDELPTIVHEDVRVSDIAFEGAHEGLEAYAGHVQMLRTAFEAINVDHEVRGVGDDSLTVEYRFRGVHDGPFMGIEATGNEVSFAGLDVYTFADDRIASIRSAFTLCGLLADIGVVELPFA